MVHIKFKYKDEYSKDQWSYQECTVRNLKECIDWYGLNECEYKILEIKEV